MANRALTLATAGLLTGSALSIATEGLLQLPTSAALPIQDSTHHHTAERNNLKQLHRFIIEDSRHHHTSDLSDIYKPPAIIPPPIPDYSGGRYLAGDTHIQYGIPYRYESHDFLLLESKTTWKYEPAVLTDYKFTSSLNFHIYSQTQSSQMADHSFIGNTELVLNSDTQAFLTQPYTFRSEGSLILDSNTNFSFHSPGFLHKNSSVNLELISDTAYTFESGPEPVIIKPNHYKYESRIPLIFENDNIHTFEPAITASYHYTTDSLELMLDGVADYRLNATALNVLRFDSGGGIILGGEARVAFSKQPPIDDFDEDLVLALAAYLLNDETI